MCKRNQIRNNSEHLSFPIVTSSLNDLLNFSINLIDNNNKTIEFNTGETKIRIFNFKTEVFLK